MSCIRFNIHKLSLWISIVALVLLSTAVSAQEEIQPMPADSLSEPVFAAAPAESADDDGFSEFLMNLMRSMNSACRRHRWYLIR
ncbi:MAG: hypothetical protein R2875_10960 [Desulfobacterales bacterium]